MARGVNKVILIGNLGHSPELKTTPGGQAVCKFNLATNETFKDRDGNQQERTEWHKCVAWGRLAEVCKQYLSRGSAVYIEGSLRTSKWEDENGQKREKTEVHIFEVRFLGGGDGQGQGERPGQATTSSSGPGDDDIPF